MDSTPKCQKTLDQPPIDKETLGRSGDSIPKRHKPLDQPPNDEETLVDDKEDRISNLPDSILCDILSRLPTKFAVGTTILSSKWKHLFSQIPNLALHIDDSELLHPHPSNNTDSESVNRPNSNFVRFMYHLLTVTLHDYPCIRKLHLICNQDYGNDHFDAWLSAALRLNVSELSLFFVFFDVKNTGVSIDSIFSCKTLKKLLWSQDYVLNVPSSVCLPNLKRLMFYFVIFPDGDSLERVLEGCPVLEDLSLDGCVFEDVDVLRISSHSLKFLIVRNCNACSAYNVEIDTPGLELLSYIDFVALGYLVENLNWLLKAHIDVGPSDEQLEDVEDGDISFYDQNVVELVVACSNVDFLYLSKASVSAIYSSSCSMPFFHNLTELEFGDVNIHGWELLPQLLESAPNLEILGFKGFSEYNGCYARFQSSLPNYVPTCLSLHIREIYFEEFNGEEDELDLVEYFLKTAEVLRKMKFSFCSSLSLEKQFYTWTKLLLLQKCSRDCQIDFATKVKMNIVQFCERQSSLEQEKTASELIQELIVNMTNQRGQ